MTDFTDMDWDEIDEIVADLEPVGEAEYGADRIHLFGRRGNGIVYASREGPPAYYMSARVACGFHPLDDGARALLAEVLLRTRAGL